MTCKYTSSLVVCLLLLLFPGATKARTDISDILSKIKVAKDDTSKINLYEEAINYYKNTAPDSAYSLAESGLKVATQIKSQRGEAFMLWQLGSIDRAQGRLVSAKVRLKEAMDIYRILGMKKNIAIVSNDLGVVEGIQGNYETATQFFLDALKIYEAQKDYQGLGQTYIKLGTVNESLNNLDKAGVYYNKAFELSKRSGDSVNMAYLYNNMGILEGRKENNTQSFRYFQDGLALCNNGDKFISIRISLQLNTGIAYERLGKEDVALAHYDTALKRAREHHLRFDEPNILLNIALLDHAVTRQQKIPILTEALTMAKETDQKNVQVNIYRTLADVFFETGNYKDAYLYQDTSNNIEKEIYSLQKNKEIVNLESLYELDKSQNKIVQLEQQGNERNFQRNVLIVIAAIIAIALIFVLTLYRKTKVLNAELHKGKEELARSNQVKDKMFSIIGHDLRTPTNSILGMLHVLQAEKNNMTREDEKEVYRMLKNQSEASLDTLNKLLLWGSRQIKGITLQLENFEVRTVIESNMRLLNENASEKHITLTNKVPGDISIYADVSHFDFIVRNLLSNAIKFSNNNGHIEVGVDEKHSNGFVCFYVKDDGVGVRPEMKNTIFSLNNLSQPGTESEKGTGLGLVLCRDFVEQDGGKIWVESEPGKGSIFYFLMKRRML